MVEKISFVTSGFNTIDWTNCFNVQMYVFVSIEVMSNQGAWYLDLIIRLWSC